MYHYVVGAGVGSFLVAYGIYKSCCAKGREANSSATLSTMAQSAQGKDETQEGAYQSILKVIHDDLKEITFNQFRNMLARTIDLLRLWPSKIMEEGIWRVPSEPAQIESCKKILEAKDQSDLSFSVILHNPVAFEKMFDAIVLFSTLKTNLQEDLGRWGRRYSDCRALLTNIKTSKGNTEEIQSHLKTYINDLIHSGRPTQAFVLHNLFYLLSYTNANKEHNKMGAQQLGVCMMPWLMYWLGDQKCTTISDVVNQTKFYEKIIEAIVTDVTFCFDFETALSKDLYKNNRPKESKKLR